MVNESGPRNPRQQENQERNHYEVLGVSRDATAQEIRASWITRVKECHPDAPGGGNQEGIRAVNAAWEVLQDTDKRSQYDLSLPLQSVRRPRPAPRQPAPEPPPPKPETPKAPERMTPAEILKKARQIAAYDKAQDFLKFIGQLREENYNGVERLIEDSEVQESIIAKGIKRTWGGALDYDIYVRLWAQTGFQRGILDSHPEVLEIIYSDLRSNIDLPTMFGNHLRDWARYNPVITLQSVLAEPSILKKIQTKLGLAQYDDYKEARRDGREKRDDHLNTLLAEWRNDAKIDISSFVPKPESPIEVPPLIPPQRP